jgi:hypothetical protein
MVAQLRHSRPAVVINQGWSFNGQFTKVALERLLAVAIAGIARFVGNQLVLALTQVVRYLGVQDPLDQRLGQSLQEAALAYQVFWFFVVRQQCVNQYSG